MTCDGHQSGEAFRQETAYAAGEEIVGRRGDADGWSKADGKEAEQDQGVQVAVVIGDDDGRAAPGQVLRAAQAVAQPEHRHDADGKGKECSAKRVHAQ